MRLYVISAIKTDHCEVLNVLFIEVNEVLSTRMATAANMVRSFGSEADFLFYLVADLKSVSDQL